MKDGRCRTGKLAEQVGELGDEGDADEGDTAARDELLHPLLLGRGVIAAVALQQVDGSPRTQTAAQSDDHSLHDINSSVKKFHSKISFWLKT